MISESGYLVSYECDCGACWQTQWSCACDDECPDCGVDVEALDYELDGTRTQEELDACNGCFNTYHARDVLGDEAARAAERAT